MGVGILLVCFNYRPAKNIISLSRCRKAIWVNKFEKAKLDEGFLLGLNDDGKNNLLAFFSHYCNFNLICDSNL